MKYKITITETFVCDVEVEANSIEEAIEKGEYYYFDDDFAEDHMGIPTHKEMTVETEHERVEGIEF